MRNTQIMNEQLRQTEIMTFLSEKRTILSEIRTWVTMILLPISIITASLAIIKTNTTSGSNLFKYLMIFSILFGMFILYFIVKNLVDLFSLNQRIKKFGLP